MTVEKKISLMFDFFPDVQKLKKKGTFFPSNKKIFHNGKISNQITNTLFIKTQKKRTKIKRNVIEREKTRENKKNHNIEGKNSEI